MLGTILIIILILILIGALPTWPHSSGWGYYPSGGVGLILIIVIVLLLLGQIGRPSVAKRDVDRADLSEAFLLIDPRRAQHLRVGEAHAAISQGEAGLGLSDKGTVLY